MKALNMLLGLCIVAAIVASCEQPPASMSFRTTLDGRPTGCTAMVFNDKGKQILEIPSDLSGVGYIETIKPGSYTVKFRDNNGNMYAVQREVTLEPGGQETLEVDLGEAGPADAGTTESTDTGSSDGE